MAFDSSRRIVLEPFAVGVAGVLGVGSYGVSGGVGVLAGDLVWGRMGLARVDPRILGSEGGKVSRPAQVRRNGRGDTQKRAAG